MNDEGSKLLRLYSWINMNLSTGQWRARSCSHYNHNDTTNETDANTSTSRNTSQQDVHHDTPTQWDA